MLIKVDYKDITLSRLCYYIYIFIYLIVCAIRAIVIVSITRKSITKNALLKGVVITEHINKVVALLSMTKIAFFKPIFNHLLSNNNAPSSYICCTLCAVSIRHHNIYIFIYVLRMNVIYIYICIYI